MPMETPTDKTFDLTEKSINSRSGGSVCMFN